MVAPFFEGWLTSRDTALYTHVVAKFCGVDIYRRMDQRVHVAVFFGNCFELGFRGVQRAMLHSWISEHGHVTCLFVVFFHTDFLGK